MRRLPNALKALFQRSIVEEDLDDEMRYHLEMETLENVAKGMSSKAARRAALKSFGGVEQLKEDCRDAWSMRILHEFLRDLRMAFGNIGKNKGYVAVIILTLGLCLGINGSVFSMLNNVMFKTYPYPEADRLVRLGEIHTKEGNSDRLSLISVRKYLERKNIEAFESTALFRTGGDNLFFEGQAFRVITGRVTPSFFSTIQVAPLIGRDFEGGESAPGKTNVIILSYDLWQKSFQGNERIIGQMVDIEGISFEIIGVMPEGFYFIHRGVSLWRPMMGNQFGRSRKGWNNNRFASIARLKPGFSIQQGQAQLDAVDAGMYEKFPERKIMIDRIGLQSCLRDYHEYRTRNSKNILYLLQASVLFVFIIGCVNVVNLVFARTTVRLREIALRISLGAPVSRIARMLLTEGLLYGVFGGALGLVLGWGGLSYIKRYDLYSFPRIESLSLDWAVVAYVCVLSLVSGFIIGLIPLFMSLKKNLPKLIGEDDRTVSSSRRGNVTRQILAIVQVSLTCVMLIGMGLLVRSLNEILKNETGFEQENLVSASLELRDNSQPEEQLVYGARLLDRLNKIPGVLSASLSSFVPFFGSFEPPQNFHIEGRQYFEDRPHPTFSYSITQGPYFETMGIPLVAGRTFNEQDMVFNSPLVVIIDQRVANQYFPHENPIGKRLTSDLGGPFSAAENASWATIIGVVGNVKRFRLDETSEGLNPHIFVNAGAKHSQAQCFVIRVSSSGEFNFEEFREEVRLVMSDVRASVPSTELLLMSQLIDQTLVPRKATIRFLITFGGLAFILSAIGVYGVLAYSVALRKKEIGIRAALGAKSDAILNMVLFQGMRIAVVGLLIGIFLAAVLMRFIEDRLYQTGTLDPIVYASVAVALLLVAFCASLLPARKAVKADPIVSLRYD